MSTGSAATYPAPPEEMCEFLIDSFCRLSEYEQLESQELAKRLLELYEGNGKFHTIQISDAFPWMYQVGLLDYESRMCQRGGNRLFLWRSAGPDKCKKILSERFDLPGVIKSFMDSHPRDEPDKKKKKKKPSASPAASAPSAPPEQEDKPPSSKRKKGKKCCDDPKIVKSKKTGKRRCKNCGRKLKAKKKKD